MVISHTRHTECSAFTKARQALHMGRYKRGVQSRLSIQWLCDNSCTQTYDVRLHIVGTNKPKRLNKHILLHLHSSLNIHSAHPVFARLDTFVCHGPLLTTYIALLTQISEDFSVPWSNHCVTVHHLHKCISCNRAIAVFW